jgi:hypothetical protein
MVPRSYRKPKCRLPCRLPKGRAHAYIAGMDLKYWQTNLREAEAELDSRADAQ